MLKHPFTQSMQTHTDMTQVLIFGEALFDVFPDNRKVLGGAPFNVAWNLQQFNARPLFISRIGNDDNGQSIIDQIQQIGMDVQGIQRDPAHPTGTVSITMDATGHQFNINADQAYDYIDSQPLNAVINNKNISLIYFGSLASRSPQSRQTLHSLLGNTIPAFVDINLRSPWWTLDEVRYALHRAHYAKLNDEEVLTISEQLSDEKLSLEQGIDYLNSQFDFKILIVTCGEQGAYLCTADDKLFRPAPAVTQLQDTIGAGDAFSSVIIYGLIHEWPVTTLLERALDFASRVCSLQGAITTDPHFYQHTQKEWQSA